MARQNLALQTPLSAGIIPAYTAAHVDGFAISNDGRTIVHVKNANAGTCNVTIQTPETVDGLAVSDRVIAIATGTERFICVPTRYNQPDSAADAGKIYMDFSVQSSVTVAAIHHP